MIDRHMTPVQLQNAYRLAVQSSLVIFYKKSDDEAKSLVDSWWLRASSSDDIRSGMYLHSEAIATAADIAHVKEMPVTEEIQQRYYRILHDSTLAALTQKRRPAKNSKRVEAEQMTG
ncbi:MAG TPA: hypothetical protein VIJ79_09550 [Acidobacteriaceae bacterium]